MADQETSGKQGIEGRLIARAMKDEAFAEALRRDPKATVEREIGKLPDGINVHVLEESPTNLYLVLPARPAKAGELSDSDLETVAGGGTYESSNGYTCW